ncbi:hypothetical protein HDU91_005745, partial [Kappamyces sp. JEL0680]
ISEIPAEISYMKNLTHLSINKNKLKTLPPEIGYLSKLEELLVADNQLELLPSTIGLLSKLAVLQLRCNNLTEIPVEIGLLAKLVSLDLSYNPIVCLPSEFAKLSIKIVQLNGCHSLLREAQSTPTPGVISLKELAARCLIRNNIVVHDPNILDYLMRHHPCSTCGGPYIDSFQTRIRFVFLQEMIIPLEYRLCTNHWSSERERILTLFAPLPATSPKYYSNLSKWNRLSITRGIMPQRNSIGQQSLATKTLLKSPSLPSLKEIPGQISKKDRILQRLSSVRLRTSKSMTFYGSNAVPSPIHQ